MVDDQVDRDGGVDLLRIAAQAGQRRAHSRQVDHDRNAGEVLQDQPPGVERNRRSLSSWLPAGQVNHILARRFMPVQAAQRRFKEHADRKRQPAELSQSGVFQPVEAVNRVRSGARGNLVARIENILFHSILQFMVIICLSARERYPRAGELPNYIGKWIKKT